MPASPGGGGASPSPSAGGAAPAWRRGRRSSQLNLYAPGRQSVNREGFEKMVKTLVALEDDKKRMKDEFDAERACAVHPASDVLGEEGDGDRVLVGRRVHAAGAVDETDVSGR